jgi:hypothetical protein
MVKLESGKSLFLMNLVGTVYFSHLLFLLYLKIETDAITAFHEIFTTLFLAAGIVVVIYTLKVFRKDHYKLNSFSFWAIVLIVCNVLILTIATMFYN